LITNNNKPKSTGEQGGRKERHMITIIYSAGSPFLSERNINRENEGTTTTTTEIFTMAESKMQSRFAVSA
jgi:hypothetical protein